MLFIIVDRSMKEDALCGIVTGRDSRSRDAYSAKHPVPFRFEGDRRLLEIGYLPGDQSVFRNLKRDVYQLHSLLNCLLNAGNRIW